ncbi:MAG: MlaD family protein [Alphaproteobacteria bacterium]|nr:MlaD family protein [Alphaproteobacteria bacterium]
MSRKANPKVIGGFVLGAIGILVVGLLTFGSGKIFQETRPGVMFFSESVAGLNAGAPVTFQGVTIGSVTEVRIEFDPDTLEVRIPVFVEIEPARIVRLGKAGREIGYRGAELVAAGMRAQLVPVSLVTGQLAVNLDFHPDTPINLVGADLGVPEWPTIPSGLQAILERIEKIPIQELVETAISLLNDLDELVESGELKSSLSSLSAGLSAFAQLLETINTDAGPIMGNVRTGTAEANQFIAEASQVLGSLSKDIDVMLADLRTLVGDINSEVRPLSQSIQDAAGSAERALDQAEVTLKTADGVISRDSPLRRDLEVALRNLTAASKSIRNLADQLERNPNAILTGKQ